MIFPECDSLTDTHGLGKQVGLLPGKTQVGTHIKKRFDTCSNELRDRAVHGDHGNVSIFFHWKVFGGRPRSNNKHCPFLNVAALIEVMHMKWTRAG
ncbi:hypothetical protein D3C84_923910 [compost metagenome]